MDGFSVMASVFPFLFFIVFGMILIVFVVTFVRGIGEWHKNNNSPRITVPARVVSKRTSVSHGHHHGANGHMHTTSSTWYYVTFEVESGDRMDADIAATFSNSITLESILSFNSASNLSIPASLISNCLILCSRTSSLP